MRLSTIEHRRGERAAVWLDDRTLMPLPEDGGLPDTVEGLLERGLDAELRDELRAVTAEGGVPLDIDEVTFRPLIRRSRKLWGIGLNYRAHAADLSAPEPTEPASFIKGDHTIIGPEDDIVLPPQSDEVTAEAELGLVIGRTCRDVGEAEAVSYLAGVCPLLDQTAVDILQRNPRFLTRAKNFPTFLSVGPVLVTIDEVLERFGTLDDIEVATVHGGEVHRRNVVADMAFGPEELISFHSRVMPLFPGDIISSGTPGAATVDAGDVVECRIEGIGRLRNHVVRNEPLDPDVVRRRP
jgi:2-keto-4-pentenoate hydratase/2-oxohepta-3-ene-1,7-dioic acid hydratase in catechol pathway